MQLQIYRCTDIINVINLYFYTASDIERMQDMLDIVRDNVNCIKRGNWEFNRKQIELPGSFYTTKQRIPIND